MTFQPSDIVKIPIRFLFTDSRWELEYKYYLIIQKEATFYVGFNLETGTVEKVYPIANAEILA